MTNEELKESITSILSTITFDETGEFLTANIAAEELYPLMKELKENNSFGFDYLFCLTCIDWKDHLLMMYHMLSKTHRHTLVIRAKITDVNNAEIASVTDLWKTAIFHEREVFDLFGVTFTGHPDMRRIFLDDDWEGNPLRKNYVDENMITI
jgi:NADH-quinone oxidoreductase subunit C